MKIRISLSSEVVDSLRQEAREFVHNPDNQLKGWAGKLKLKREK